MALAYWLAGENVSTPTFYISISQIWTEQGSKEDFWYYLQFFQFQTDFFLQLARSHRITMVRLREWWQDRLFLFLFICSSALFVVETVSTTSTAGDSSCNVYSSLDTDDFWVSVGRCAPCIQSTGCGFCQSTLQCMNGTASGPSNGFPCPTWTYSLEQCPALPHCETFSNCGSCATQDQCAWCASEGNPPLIFF